MNIEISSTTRTPASESHQQIQSQHATSLSRIALLVESVVIVSLAITAFLPRLLLAMRLDMVTDEIVYISAGKTYFPLLTHLQIGASGWLYNYEHPPFVKLLIGLALTLNSAIGHPLSELLTARLPSIVMGTVLVIAVYYLARAPFGRVVALAAALCLAMSPWLVYFSALAYLDMTMTTLITIAYLLTWHAIRRPWLYPVIALLIGLGAASKYTAVLAIPGVVVFTAYYFFVIRLYIPKAQRPRIPWLWWCVTIVLAPAVFFAADPAIWPHPISLLLHSFNYEWNHSYNGHLTFLDGKDYLHVPHWAILYIIIAKMSAFVTVPAAFFSVMGLIQLLRFHMGKIPVEEATNIAFLWIWLVFLLGMFSLLNIVVGTHYHIPLAAPVALSGAVGLASVLRYQRGSLPAFFQRRNITSAGSTHSNSLSYRSYALHVYPLLAVALLMLALFVPHFVGLTTVYGAEGYTSEFFPGENRVLQVAYPGYREAIQWIGTQTSGQEQVGLGAVVGTLSDGRDGVSWYSYNRDLPARLKLIETHPDDTYTRYNYVVWPMHLVQRGFALPKSWHIVHIVMGGRTVYCYVLAPFIVKQAHSKLYHALHASLLYS